MSALIVLAAVATLWLIAAFIGGFILLFRVVNFLYYGEWIAFWRDLLAGALAAVFFWALYHAIT